MFSLVMLTQWKSETAQLSNLHILSSPQKNKQGGGGDNHAIELLRALFFKRNKFHAWLNWIAEEMKIIFTFSRLEKYKNPVLKQ